MNRVFMGSYPILIYVVKLYQQENKIKYPYLTVVIKIQHMFLHPRTPRLRTSPYLFNNIKVFNQFEKCN